MKFTYSDELLVDHPQIVGGIIQANYLHNRPTPSGLQDHFLAEQERVRAGIQGALSEIPSLAAWRQAFRRFGANPTKYRSAPEALLRRLTKKGDLPSINTLVDIGNLVSIRYALPVAVFDCRAVQSAVTVHPAVGTEHYRELGETEIIHPPAGEVIFSDETGLVIARRWCWRQSAESAAREDSTDVLIAVEAQHDDGRQDVERAVQDLVTMLTNYCGGQMRHTILDGEHPAFGG